MNSNWNQRATRALLVTCLAAVLALPHPAYSQNVDEEPSALAMAGDLVVARPVGVVITVLGSAAYVVSLPFSLAGGNAKQAGEALVVGPAMSTFVRCLGCTRSGYRQSTGPVDTTEQ